MHKSNNRWNGIIRPYTIAEVEALRPSVRVEHTVARKGAQRLWTALNNEHSVRALGAMTGGQAVQMARAGLQAIYCSGWQVAADANLDGETYPDQSLYDASSVPALVRRINSAFTRTNEIERSEGNDAVDWFLPIIADAEAGFGGKLNVFELMKKMIVAGASAVHLEDQLSSEKKCGHLGGKVLVPMQEFIEKLVGARLAADVLDVPTILIARTDANSANLLNKDVDPRDKPFCTGETTSDGYSYINGGIDYAIARGLAYAPYADMLWCETSKPDVKEARRFAEAIHAKFPGKLLAYNCSPSFNWKKHLSDDEIASFQDDIAAMGYKFQFVTLAGFHALNLAMFELSLAYAESGMSAYSALQEREFALAPKGYTAHRHQREVGTGFFDKVALTISGGQSSTTALEGSTEKEQFEADKT